MQVEHFGGVGDFGKFALLRYLMKDHRLAVCWYLTGQSARNGDDQKYFEYLRRPNEFRHLAPDVFDHLKSIVEATDAEIDPVTAVQLGGLLGDAVFVRSEVPQQAHLRQAWARELVTSVSGATLVLLDPDNGIEGERLTRRHVALAEIAALRRHDRTLIVCHRQSGRSGEAKFLATKMRSIGCNRVELIRFRHVSSRFYIVSDHDAAASSRLAEFARRWGDRVKAYTFE